jgi:glycerophosphoryl diester phosphodiesterase
MKTTGYFDTHPGNRPRIFAHRGLTQKDGKAVADENTLESFELALEVGADYLESDIQVTKDQVPVLFHDNDLRRLVGKKTSISALTLNELSQIPLPLGGKIPTLASALEKFPKAKFNLDIKTPAAESVGMNVLSEMKALDRVLVSSFSEKSRRRALAYSPESVATSAGSSLVLASYLYARSKNTAALQKAVQQVHAFQLPTKRFGLDFTHPTFLEQILPIGIEIHYWTINDPEQMKLLFALGAHGIVTDRTDIAVKVFS